MSTDAASAVPSLALATRVAGRRWLLPLLALLFFATGSSGLMYQVLWLRILTLTFGVTVYAVATVLSSFMAGLGLGSFLAGKIADRLANPLRIYGLVEILVGVSGALTLVAFRLVHLVYVTLAPLLPGDSLLGVSLLRAFLSLSVLIVPTSLMGATLPIIVKSSFLRLQGLSGNISLLYAVNTFGAMIGTFSAGFFLIGLIGIQTSILLAACINIGAGLTAVVASRFISTPAMASDLAPADPSEPSHETYPQRVLLTVLLVFALSGFCSLAYEVVWTRILSLLFPATTYAFTLMLTTVLFGIAAGSYAINLVINRRGPWLLAFAGIEIVVGLWALGSIELLSHIYGITNRLGSYDPLQFLVSGEYRFVAFVSFVIMFPPMFLLGMSFPIATKLFISGATTVGERVGTVYAANVVGAIFGSFTAGFVLVPTLGSQGSLLTLAAINLWLGFVLLAVTPRLAPTLKLATVAVAGTLLGYALLFGPPMQQLILAGRFPGETVWHQEGLETTVSVVREREGELVLYLNGQHQANDSVPMVALHRLIGHLPMLLHPHPHSALAIGLGGGATPGAISQHQGVEVDIVELSPSVVNAASLFHHINYDVLNRPNVHLRLDDGRNYLLLTDRKYDVITADVIRPRHAGSANLYSADYYRLAREALTDDGLMVIWLDPSLSDFLYKLMIRTFLDVFPYATLWHEGMLIIGSKSPVRIDAVRIQRALNEPNTARALAERDIYAVADVAALFVATDEELRAYVGPGPIITDDRPLIEYYRHLPTGGEPDRSRFSRDPRAILQP